MSEAKIRGVVEVIEETKTYGQKGFRKRLVVLTQDNGRFVNYVPVEFIRDACDTVDDMAVGQEVEISYQLMGRKWQRDPNSEVKYFLNAEASASKSSATANLPSQRIHPVAMWKPPTTRSPNPMMKVMFHFRMVHQADKNA